MKKKKAKVNYLCLIRKENCAVQVSTNPTKDINDCQSQPARHLFKVTHDCEVKDEGTGQMNDPETRFITEHLIFIFRTKKKTTTTTAKHTTKRNER